MTRNTAQVLGYRMFDRLSEMIICWTPYGQDVGGTSRAIRIARATKIPVFNLYDEGEEEKILKFVENVEKTLDDTP